MNKKSIILIACLILAGTYGIATAECNCAHMFYTEGPSYECDCNTNQQPVVYQHVEFVDHETFITEGMRISPPDKGPETLSPADTSPAVFFTEGYTEKEWENHLQLIEADKIMPAAGN